MSAARILKMTEQNILDHVQGGLAVRSKEKDEFAEVFTPPVLIDELLDALPSAIWTNPNARWLDPAAGHGNFGALIYSRLMKSLSRAIPHVQSRKRHILDKMLFMVELNPQNVRQLRQLFGQKARISLADFLLQRDKWTRDLGRDNCQFDVILGNPPFQTEKKGTYDGAAGNRTLWDKFVKCILDRDGKSGDNNNPLLKESGCLAFITPAGWRRPDSPLYDLMTKQNHLLFLHIYGKGAGADTFGVDTRFDTYVIQRPQQDNNNVSASSSSSLSIPTRKATEVIDEMGQIHRLNLKRWPFIPNYAFDQIQRILVKPSSGRGIPVIFSAGDYDARKLTKNKTRKSRYPIVHTITQKGLGLRYTKDRKTTQFGIPKVLLNFNERQYPYNDFAGKYGMSQLTFGIPIRSEREGEAWVRALTSPAFEEILKATKWGAFQTDYRMFRYFDRDLYKNPEFARPT